jgi:serine/threonine protein kinase
MAVPGLPAGYELQEYRIEKLLGVGGFGLTYLAIDTNLKLRVAVKEYLPGEIAARGADQSVTPNSSKSAEDFMWGKRRFLDESRTLASFRHPNIVRVMRFFEANGSAYMVMEYVEGDALNDWIKPRRPLPEKQVAALAAALLDGLVVVHNAGYLHRDVKPSNIFVRYDGSPVLLDFGSARRKNNELTAIVTPGYAPFEQYHTQGKQGPWSDLYALAGVLYWMVTGNRPLEAPARVRQDTMPPAVTAAKGKYRAEFLAAIDWALAPHEDARPRSVSDWSAALVNQEAQAKTQLSVAPARPDLTLQPTALPQAQDFDAGFLEEVERELTHHLGPIAQIMVRHAAKQARDSSDLIQLLAADITQPGLRVKFERRFAELSRPLSRSPTITGPTGSSQPAGARFSASTLAKAEERLSQYLGPVAKLVVRQAASKARDESELYLLVADEIENPAEKKAFIRRAISSKV